MRTSGLEARRIKSRPRGTEGRLAGELAVKAENEDNSQGRGWQVHRYGQAPCKKGSIGLQKSRAKDPDKDLPLTPCAGVALPRPRVAAYR